MSRTLAFILGRAGSQGVPGKNTKRLLCGKPLYVWAIEAALEAKGIDDVLWSTDDPVAQEKGLALGAMIHNRPPELSTGRESVEDVLIHALEHRDPVSWDTVVILQPTSPLRTAADINDAIGYFENTHSDSLLSGVWTHTPFYWTEGGRPYGPGQRPNRQQLQPVFQENGAIYISRILGLVQHRDRLHGAIAHYPMGPEHRDEIDDEIDWVVIEALMERRLQGVTVA